MPKKAIDLPSVDKCMMMLYGDNTTGKSVCATHTAPKPLLMLDIDDRPQTYAGLEGVEYEIFKNDGKTATAYRELASRLRSLSREDELKYRTIVLDSTTSLLDIITDDILGLSGKGSGAHEGLDLKHWGSVDERFRKFFTTLKRLNCLCIVVSHEQVFKDENLNVIYYAAMRVGQKISMKAPGYFDEVYRCYVTSDRKTKKRQYLMQTQRDGRYPARTSYNLQDPEVGTVPILDVEEPQNIQKVLGKIERAHKNPEEFLRRVKAERGL